MAATAERFAGFHSSESGRTTMQPRTMHLNWTVLMMLASVFTVVATLWTFDGIDPVLGDLMQDLSVASALTGNGFHSITLSN